MINLMMITHTHTDIWKAACDFSINMCRQVILEMSELVKNYFSPGWSSSVDWAPACKPKGHWFHAQSRTHAWVAGQVPSRGVQEETTHWCLSPSLSPPLPLCLKIQKKRQDKKKRRKENYFINLLKCPTMVLNYFYKWIF